jgi:hypothetical protein
VRRAGATAALVAPLVLLTACVGHRLELGAPLAPERLDAELRIGESSAADVARVLGRPGGQGEAWLPQTGGLRRVWLYTHEVTVVGWRGPEPPQRTRIQIYLDGDVYDGYLWLADDPDAGRGARR